MFISPFKNIGIFYRKQLSDAGITIDPTSPSVLLDFNASSAGNFVLTGTDVDTWINSGMNGLDANNGVGKPNYNSTDKALDFTSASSDSLNIESPVILPCNDGWSMLIGYKQGATNDRYIFGSSEPNGASLFMRANSINVGLSNTNSKIYNYSGWDVRRSGRAILEITHLGASGVMEVRINNGTPNDGGGPGGGSGVPGINDAFFNQIGHENGTAYWNGQIAFIYMQNKPFTTDERAAVYAAYSAIYVPE